MVCIGLGRPPSPCSTPQKNANRPQSIGGGFPIKLNYIHIYIHRWPSELLDTGASCVWQVTESLSVHIKAFHGRA